MSLFSTWQPAKRTACELPQTAVVKTSSALGQTSSQGGGSTCATFPVIRYLSSPVAWSGNVVGGRGCRGAGAVAGFAVS